MSDLNPLEEEFWRKIDDQELTGEELKGWLAKNPSLANATNPQGMSALDFAVIFKNFEHINILFPLIKDEEILKKAIAFATMKKPFDTKLVDPLLSHDIVKTNPRIVGEIILMTLKNAEAYHHLIKKLDPKIIELGKYAFLEKAIERDQVEVAKDLEKRGAKFTIKALNLAIRSNSQNMVEFLAHKFSDQQKQNALTVMALSKAKQKLSHPISVGQALLILINHYQRQKDDAKVKDLKKLYLLGAENKEAFEKIQLALQDKILSPYLVLADPKSIDNDPARRYFETHLAYETLKTTAKTFSMQEAKEYYEMIFRVVPEATKKMLAEALEGRYVNNPNYSQATNQFFSEISTCIAKVDTDPSFQTLLASKEMQEKMSPAQKKEMDAKLQEEKDKIKYLIRSIFMGVAMAWGSKESDPQSNYQLPIAIYGTGIFSEASRGKQLKGDLKEKGEAERFQSMHKGLMKRTMPVPFFDIAYAETPFSFVKPSDQSKFVSGAGWVENNFGRLVHPFSNSISGTVLCQLRTLAFLKQVLPPSLKDKEGFTKLMRGLISPVLYLTGGHTLYEFTAPLTLREVRQEFSYVKDFDEINLGSLFMEGNEAAFDQALKDTVFYNQTILNRRSVAKQLTASVPSVFDLDDAVVQSKLYIGALEKVDLTKVPVNQTSIVNHNNDYYILYKESEESDVLFYRLESTKEGLKINGQVVSFVEEPYFKSFVELFPKMLSTIKEENSKRNMDEGEMLSSYASKKDLKTESEKRLEEKPLDSKKEGPKSTKG